VFANCEARASVFAIKVPGSLPPHLMRGSHSNLWNMRGGSPLPHARRIRLQKSGGRGPPLPSPEGHVASRGAETANRQMSRPSRRRLAGFRIPAFESTRWRLACAKCTADLPLRNGFVCALGSPRLSAAAVVNGVRHARECKAESPLVDGFISGFESSRLFARALDLNGRCGRNRVAVERGSCMLSPNSGSRFVRNALWHDRGGRPRLPHRQSSE
jgi:hypothetical protein